MSRKFFRAKRDPAWNEILDRMKAYDNREHKTLVHIRTDEHISLLMSRLKPATGVDITGIVSFSISELFRQHPELKTIIKQFLQLNE
ncbi:MAG: hypothetical protein JWQ66_4470 [Mucilaginibacter sp.]|nr:hypothetical protein [Mucilaginibacter sp.]